MNKVYEILRDIRPEFDFEQSSDYIADGMLDSFDIIALVSQLDEAFNISIDGMDILPENFQNAGTIIDLIRKNGGSI